MVKMLIRDQQDYPEFASFARLELPKVRDDVRIWQAFLRHGQLNNFTATQAVSWRDDSLLLRLADLGSSNGRFDEQNPDWIVLHSEIARRFRNDHALPEARRFVQATILHELVHWGDHRDGNDQPGEEGKAFEKAAYGDDVKRWWVESASPRRSVNVRSTDLRTLPDHPQRGIRNHNPGNIRIGDAWEGLADPSQMSRVQRQEREFCVFRSPQYGIRAMGRLLLTYQKEHDLNTVLAMISRWAPPRENATHRYAKTVADKMGIEVTEPFFITQAPHPRNMIEAIIFVENGVQPYSDQIITAGLTLADLPA